MALINCFRSILLCIAFFIPGAAHAQLGINTTTSWRFLKGDSIANDIDPIYGTLGQTAEGNKPGGRNMSASWKDASGNFWLFGGEGISSVNVQAGEQLLLNDLWKLDVATNQWILMKGDNINNVPGVYGVKGVAAIENKPGARHSAATWRDNSGNLWLYGGFGYYTGGFGYLNDLWKYDPATNQWIWMHGDNSKDVSRIVGTEGIAAPQNNPGRRAGASSWTDGAGKFWLFGGGADTARSNDLWKYDPVTNQWTCMRANPIPQGRYGTQGAEHPENFPGIRSYCASFKDGSGNLWLFGGSAQVGNYNDLWRYSVSTNQWAWIRGDTTTDKAGVYADKASFSAANKPGARGKSGFWTSASGTAFYVYGGSVALGTSSYSNMNDLWVYVPSLNQWNWLSGDNVPVHSGVYGTKGTPSIYNKPGARTNPSTWMDAGGKLWMLGGRASHTVSGNYNDLWQFNPSSFEWLWSKGDSTLNSKGWYGETGYVAVGNKPGTRRGSVSWKDAAGNLYLFGGDKVDVTGHTRNDLWKYDQASNQWAWIKGKNTTNDQGTYGTKLIYNASYEPSARHNSSATSDGSKVWLFGGAGTSYLSDPADSLNNDLWKYDPAINQWAWISGDKNKNQYGVYGTKGIASPTNKPGGRRSPQTWCDAAGNLYVFGGYGYAASGMRGTLNDLWKYSVVNNNWTWLGGDNFIRSGGSQGVMGVTAPSNMPRARLDAVGWVDASGIFWLFGGETFSPYDNSSAYACSDLWKYDPATNLWTWMRGPESSTINAPGIYGTKGIASASTQPGSRVNAFAWRDANGNGYLFGGYGTGNSIDGFLNDLWKYNVSTNQWVWLHGDSSVNSLGLPGVKGVTTSNNKPVAKEDGATWIDNSGIFWMFGGTTIHRYFGQVEDLWKYDPASNLWTWVKGQMNFSAQGKFGAQGIAAYDNIPVARAESTGWTDSSGNHWLFGGSPESVNLYTYWSDLWKYDPVLNQWAWMNGDTTPMKLGVYGTKGIANAANRPGARSGSVSWIDNNGKFWLFGGKYIDQTNRLFIAFNDLWKYDPLTNNWTWMNGDSLKPMSIFTPDLQPKGVYGNLGIAADANLPPPRFYSSAWKDTSGNLWMYGGTKYNEFSGNYNDLWKYNIATNRWTWMNGDSTLNVTSVYGTQGAAAISNKPGARALSTTWVDKNGNFWLFGGDGYNSNLYNDLWKYNPVSNIWTWMKGDNFAYGGENITTPGVADAANKPGARHRSHGWTDIYGNLWLFGGSKSFAGALAVTNDLWKFDITSNQWTYFNGGQDQYGTANKPGSRHSGVAWTDKSGNLLLFGGHGYGTTGVGFLNDLWKIFTGTKYVFIGSGAWPTSSNWLNNQAPPTTITPGMDVTIDHLIPGNCVTNSAVNLQTNGILRVESGKLLTINNADLLSSGNVLGPGNLPGKITFTGLNGNALRSSGSMTTPIILAGKELSLTGNSNTSRVELSGGSKITLGMFDLNMDTATLVADNVSFIVTNDTGRIVRKVASMPVVFNVGTDNNAYTPVTVENTGLASDFRVRVVTGAANRTSSATGNVDRTWLVSATSAGTISTLRVEWSAGQEQPDFNRNFSYISQAQPCQPPPNCTDIYYDIAARTAATVTGPGTFSQSRSGITKPTSFVVKSGPDVSTFTGSGSWDDPNNWTIGIVPSKTIGIGREIIIDYPVGGECIVNGDITVQAGGKLTVKSGKVMRVNGKVVVVE